MAIESTDFAGFPRAMVDFLIRLEEHNDKVWFEQHRDEFIRSLQEPLQELVVALTPCMLAIDPEFEVAPRTDKTICRIYTDTRFSRDKSPYRTNMWITFKRPSSEWQGEPAFYFDVSATGYSSDMGCYSPPRSVMDAFRALVSHAPDEFRKAIGCLDGPYGFEVGGERYKRAVAGAPEGLESWFEYKSFYIHRDSPTDDRLFSPGLAEYLAEGFAALAPLYHCLWIASERGQR